MRFGNDGGLYLPREDDKENVRVSAQIVAGPDEIGCSERNDIPYLKKYCLENFGFTPDAYSLGSVFRNEHLKLGDKTRITIVFLKY